MKKIEMYCVTNKDSPYLNKTPYNLAAVGKATFQKIILDVIIKTIFFTKKKIILS